MGAVRLSARCMSQCYVVAKRRSLTRVLLKRSVRRRAGMVKRWMRAKWKGKHKTGDEKKADATELQTQATMPLGP